MLWQCANVVPVVLEDVVGHEDDRHGAHELSDLLLASDPLLQCREGEWPVVAEGEHFAVEDGALRQAGGGRGMISGKRWVMSSSPRDQRCRPLRV